MQREFFDRYGDTLVRTTVITEEVPTTKYGVSIPPSMTPAEIYIVYPNCSVFRVFVGAGADIPLFTSSRFNGIRPQDDVWVSFKKFDIPMVTRFLNSVPSDRTGNIILTYAHEPEQGPSQGDPEKATWVNNWYNLGDSLKNRTDREKIKLVPVLTNYYQLRNDWRDWLPWEAYEAGHLDGIGFNIYNHDLDKTRYNSPASLYAEMLEASREIELPAYVGECNTERISGDSGTLAAEWFIDMMNFVYDENVAAWCQFNSGGGVLPGKRLPEYVAVKEFIQNQRFF